MRAVSPSELIEILETRFVDPSAPPVLIFGSPGEGKTQIVRDLATKHGAELRTIRLSSMAQEDVSGVMVPDIEKRLADYWSPELLEMPDDMEKRHKIVLFFDELGCAKTDVQNAALNLFQDGVLHNVDIRGAIRIAATNRPKDKVFVKGITSALINRCCVVELQNTVKDWIKWARQNLIHPAVISYIDQSGGTLRGEPSITSAYPTPRAWEYVSRECYRAEKIGLKPKALTAMIAGYVGEQEASKFRTYLTYYRELPKPTDDPEQAIRSILEHKRKDANIYLYMYTHSVAMYVQRAYNENKKQLKPEHIRQFVLLLDALYRIDKQQFAAAAAHIISIETLYHIMDRCAVNKRASLNLPQHIFNNLKELWSFVNDAIGEAKRED